MNPDYKKYSLIELYDVKDNIDYELYPERYNLLLLEIKLREANPGAEPKPSKLNEEDRGSILKIIIAMCAIYFSFSLIQAYRFESIWYKNDREYFLDTNPEGFYFVVSVYIALLAATLYAFLKEIPNKKINKDT